MARAMDVEDLLIWAFRDQKIEHVANAMRPRGPGGSNASSLGELLALGCRVDTSSAGASFLGGAQCHEDAAVMYDAVMALPPDAWSIVIRHARTGTRPDWHPEGPGYWVTPLDSKGNPKRLWRDPAKQKGDLGPAPQELIGTRPSTVEQDRRIYAVWHAALGDLVSLVNAEMADHVATPPEAPAEPWCELEAAGERPNGGNLQPSLGPARFSI